MNRTQCPECETDSPKIVIRAREYKDTWGHEQVLECRKCNHRWSE